MLGVLAGLRFHVWNLAVLEAEGALRKPAGAGK
jgi:hypothetical protein